jgi:hypothetical protein
VLRPLAWLANAGLVVALATSGVFACPCADASPSPEGGPSCHDTAAGLSAAPMACGCPCLSSAPAERPATRLGPVLTPGPGVTLSSVALLPRREIPSVVPAEASTDPPAPPRRLILRI